jgi:hypothetical protein
MWWKNNEKQYPRLSLLAKQYLGISSSSVSSERVFSKVGHLISKRRANLSPKLVNKLVLMNKNINYM